MEARRAERQGVFARQRPHHQRHVRRLRRAPHRRPGLHVDRHHELAVDLGAARPHQLGEREPGQRFGVHLGDRAHGGRGRRGAAQRERRQETGLVVRRIHLQRVEHGGVPHQRRVAVDHRRQHRVVAHEVVAEHDSRHVHGVGRPLARRHDAHERLVRMPERRMDDVQMPVRHGHVHRLADDRAGRMERTRHVGEAMQVLEVGERAVAPDVVEIAHERRAVHRHEDGAVAAHAHRAGRVAGVHRVALRDQADELHQLAAADPDAESLDVRAGGLPHCRRLVVAELDADVLQDPAGLFVDELDRFVGQDVIDRNPADQGGKRRGRRCPLAATGVAAAPAGGMGRGHWRGTRRSSGPVPMLVNAGESLAAGLTAGAAECDDPSQANEARHPQMPQSQPQFQRITHHIRARSQRRG
jgi:hypothetical protein